MLVFCSLLFAQNFSVPLKVGDSIPDAFWTTGRKLFISGKGLNQDLAPFKKKLIILDFWATWCGPCISSLSELDAIYKKFGSDLVVLPVSDQPEGVVLPFIADRKWGFTFMVGRDSWEGLNRMFPHITIPHQVWIKDGRVLYITNRFAATVDNIQKTLDGKKVVVHAKNDAVDYDKKLPLFFRGNGGDGSTVRYQSMIAGFTPGLLSVSMSNSNPGGQLQSRIVYPNKQVVFLYQEAASAVYGRSFFLPARFKMELPTELAIRVSAEGVAKPAFTKWAEDNAVTYSLILPKGTNRRKLYSFMLEDLNRYFSFMNIKGTVEERMVDCLLLSRIGKAKLEGSLGDSLQSVRVVGGIKKIKNLSPEQTVSVLQSSFPEIKRPIVFDKELSGLLSLDFSVGGYDLARLNSDLEKSGFVLKEKKRLVQLLVISLLDKKVQVEDQDQIQVKDQAQDRGQEGGNEHGSL